MVFLKAGKKKERKKRKRSRAGKIQKKLCESFLLMLYV
jgi:hypothetical protein